MHPRQRRRLAVGAVAVVVSKLEAAAAAPQPTGEPWSVILSLVHLRGSGPTTGSNRAGRQRNLVLIPELQPKPDWKAGNLLLESESAMQRLRERDPNVEPKPTIPLYLSKPCSASALVLCRRAPPGLPWYAR